MALILFGFIRTMARFDRCCAGGTLRSEADIKEGRASRESKPAEIIASRERCAYRAADARCPCGSRCRFSAP
jgi:hypothetical protein